jgi:hypothetical protein
MMLPAKPLRYSLTKTGTISDAATEISNMASLKCLTALSYTHLSG